MTLTDLDPVQETSPGSLLFQLLGIAHSVTHRLAETLAELGLSAAGLDLLTQLAHARKPLPLEDLGVRAGDRDPRDVVVMLERDGLVRSLTHGPGGGRVTIVLTSLGATRQQTGAERLGAVREQFARTLGGVDSAALERALSALR